MKTLRDIREALEVGTDEIVDAYKKATPGEVNELTAKEKKLVNQMYDKRGNLTPLGKKVMNHGKKPGDKGYIESVNEEDMPASPDEAGMAMDQAKFIGYVADEIMEYIQGNNEFPEWMQNKLSALHEKAKGVHAVMAGKYNESVQESVEEAKVECPKCKGEGCDHCDGKGYHMTEAKQKNWTVTVVKPINKLKKGMKVIVPARNTAEAIKKALKKMGENPAAIGSGHLDVKLDKSLGESVQIDEAKFTPKEIKMAIGIASDPRYKGGNMTGAAKAINKIKKGLSDYPQVAAVLKRQNESVDLEEKLQVSDGMAKWIEDFQKSDAPQFVEKDKNERREMAIAAYLAAKRKAKKED